jgi:hypothetical protein
MAGGAGMSDPWRLSEKHSLPELQEMLSAAMSDPSNRNPPGGVLIYNVRGKRRIDAIADAISLRLKQWKIDNGTYETSGYSGRNSNRR